jgi:flagellar biogenesis protein FliO
MEMKTGTSENLWLGFLLLGLIIVLAIFLFMAGVEVIKKISAEISPVSKQAVFYEIRG